MEEGWVDITKRPAKKKKKLLWAVLIALAPQKCGLGYQGHVNSLNLGIWGGGGEEVYDKTHLQYKYSTFTEQWLLYNLQGVLKVAFHFWVSEIIDKSMSITNIQ